MDTKEHSIEGIGCMCVGRVADVLSRVSTVLCAGYMLGQNHHKHEGLLACVEA